jgi:glycosyltransferase involved in cell wall biosynthesis
VAEGDVAGMGEALARLLADPGRARAMGEAGRARCLAGFTSAESRRRLREILGLPGPPC